MLGHFVANERPAGGLPVLACTSPACAALTPSKVVHKFTCRARLRLAFQTQRVPKRPTAGSNILCVTAASQRAEKQVQEERRARELFLAQGGRDSGDQGLQQGLLNAAVAALEDAAATRKARRCDASQTLRAHGLLCILGAGTT